MATLEELERRIRVAGDLQGVVRTMKTISAVGIRQHRIAADAIRDYVGTVELGLRGLLDGEDLPEGQPPQYPAKTLAVIVGSDIGLCGGFNARLVEHAFDHAARDRHAVRFLAMGERVEAELERIGHPPAVSLALPSTLEAVGSALRPVLAELEGWTGGPRAGRVLVFHNFQAADGTAMPRTIPLLPVNPAELGRIAARPWRSRRLPIVAGDRAALLGHLIRQYVFARLHAALIESRTAEHGARLIAMQAADRSIAEKRETLEAAYRAARQDAVTDELLDLVAGFEVLKGERNGDGSDP